MPVPETPAAMEAADFTRNVIATLQANVRTGDTQQAAEVFVDMLYGTGSWKTMPSHVKDMALSKIYTPLRPSQVNRLLPVRCQFPKGFGGHKFFGRGMPDCDVKSSRIQTVHFDNSCYGIRALQTTARVADRRPSDDDVRHRCILSS